MTKGNLLFIGELLEKMDIGAADPTGLNAYPNLAWSRFTHFFLPELNLFLATYPCRCERVHVRFLLVYVECNPKGCANPVLMKGINTPS
jgi:hypothetical protein